MYYGYRNDSDYYLRLAMHMAAAWVVVFVFWKLSHIALLNFDHPTPVEKTTAIEFTEAPSMTFEKSPPLPITPLQPLVKQKEADRYMPTMASQETKEPPKETSFYSDRNTKLTSQTEGKAENNLPNQEGAQTKFLSFKNSPSSPAIDQQPPAPAPAEAKEKVQENKTTQQPEKAQPEKVQPEKAQPLEQKPVTDKKTADKAQEKAMSKAGETLKQTNENLGPEPKKGALENTAQRPKTTPKAEPRGLEPLIGPQPDEVEPQARTMPKPASAPSFFERKSSIVGGRSAAVSPTGVTAFDTAESPVGKYTAHVLRKIRSRWEYSSSSLIEVGVVRAKFSVRSDGSVTDLVLQTDSTNSLFENICRESIVDKKSPFNSFPEHLIELIGEKKEFEITFTLY